MSRKNPRFRRNNTPLPTTTNNVAQLSVIGQLEGQQTINNFYYFDSGTALITASEQNLALAWRTSCFAKYQAAVSNEWSNVSVRVAIISAPTRIPFADTGSAGLLGTGGVGHLPTTTSAVCTRQTAFRGQCGRGRIYVPAVPLAFVTSPNESTLNATGTAAIQSLLNFTNAQIAATDRNWQPVLVSRKGLAAGAPIAQAALLTNFLVKALLGNTRRRRIGRGK